MANHSTPVKPSKEDIKKSQDFWENFMIFSKYSIIATIVVLALMALLLV